MIEILKKDNRLTNVTTCMILGTWVWYIYIGTLLGTWVWYIVLTTWVQRYLVLGYDISDRVVRCLPYLLMVTRIHPYVRYHNVSSFRFRSLVLQPSRDPAMTMTMTTTTTTTTTCQHVTVCAKNGWQGPLSLLPHSSFTLAAGDMIVSSVTRSVHDYTSSTSLSILFPIRVHMVNHMWTWGVQPIT